MAMQLPFLEPLLLARCFCWLCMGLQVSQHEEQAVGETGRGGTESVWVGRGMETEWEREGLHIGGTNLCWFPILYVSLFLLPYSLWIYTNIMTSTGVPLGQQNGWHRRPIGAAEWLA